MELSSHRPACSDMKKARIRLTKQATLARHASMDVKVYELRYMSWKGLAGIIKESKLKYRFPLLPSNAVFRARNNKKKIETLIFFNKI